MKHLLILCLLVSPAFAQAADFYVRPLSGEYGPENGTTYDTAFDGFEGIDWSQMGAGDTLWLIGTFDENLTVGAGGDASADFTIRGDHPQGDGVFAAGSLLLWSGGHSHITLYRLTLLDGYIAYGNDAGLYRTTTLAFRSPYTLLDSDSQFVAQGFQPGMNLKVNGGNLRNIFSFRVETVAPDEITISSGYPRAFNDDSSGTPTTIRGIWPNNHITIDSCDITTNTHPSSKFSVLMIGDNLTIKNSRFDGAGKARAGLFYISAREFFDVQDGVTIIGNYFTNIGGADGQDTSDNHCIGMQGAQNVTISGNIFEGCGSAFVSYPAAGRYFRNWEITNNVIVGMDYQRAETSFQWGGSGIVLTGSETGAQDSGGVIAGNVIANPLHCPSNDSSVACIGIYTKVEKEAKIYNNTIVGHDKGIALNNVYNADIQGNIILESNLYHLDVGTVSGTSHREDHNIYYPNGPDMFKYLAYEVDFATYNSEINRAYGVSGTNTNTVLQNPLLDRATFQPASDSPAVDSGLANGLELIVSFQSNTGGLGAVVKTEQDNPPDLGAVKFGQGDLPILAPTGLSILSTK